MKNTENLYQKQQQIFENQPQHVSSSSHQTFVPNPYSHKENIPNPENQDVEIDRLIYIPSEQMITNKQKVNQLSKELFLPDLELLEKYDPNLVKVILELKEADQERQRERIRILNVRPQNIPLRIEESGFFEFMLEQYEILEHSERVSKTIELLLEEIEQLSCRNDKKLSQDKINKIMAEKTKKVQTLMKELNVIEQHLQYDDKKIQQRKIIESNQCLELINKRDAKHVEAAEYQLKNSELDDQIFIANKRLEEKDKIIKLEKFETAIIKMQFGAHSFYRYGGRVVQSDYSRHDYFNLNIAKWDAQIDNMDIMDLKIFVIATLVPMSRFVFTDFSSQANVYKVLFGFGQNLGSEQIKQSFDILRNRIHKRLAEQKFPPVNSCVNDGKKKKIIFVCKLNTFNDLMDQLIKNIKNFYTQLMVIHGVKFAMIENKFLRTQFQVGKLQIDYVYEGNSVKTEIQVLYCPFENITKGDFDLVRKRVVKEESVFCWVDFPAALHQDRIHEIKDIHQMLEKCKLETFGTAVVRNKK